jgi:dTDP-4-dehydrorhamnose 3,5-epimerase
MEPITSGNFTFIPTEIDGVIVVECRAYGDSRGYFMETYKCPDFVAGGIDVEFVQDNQSSSVRGVLRGLHFQINHPQAKLVRVIQGEVFDVAVDLREGSPTYGSWTGVTLSAESNRQFFIPRGFAHGFYVLSDTAVFAYKCDDVYHPNDEGGIRWDDPEIGIKWPLIPGEQVILSEKDKHHSAFSELRDK